MKSFGTKKKLVKEMKLLGQISGLQDIQIQPFKKAHQNISSFHPKPNPKILSSLVVP